ncbi:MAG: DUF4116 domain-containing protein, partial [Verrucomicrobia bacterium]|nr:DUF4116 domain-containing protein [Verrucomicrobiota bacterium]
DLPRKKELESLIEELELSKSADVKTQYLMKQKSRITGVITHLEEEIISKNASLLRKMAETSSGKLTPFGLALIGVFTKVMTVETDVLGINNHVSKHILDWFCQLPVPVECFEGLTERLGREPSLYPVLPESLRKLPDIVSLAHTVPGLVYGVTPEKYQACMEDPISAFSRGDLVEVFENDINIVLPAILRYPPALRFAKNKEIVLEILRRDSNFFPYICEQFKNDMDIIRLIARKNPYFLQSIHRKEVILKISQENRMYLRYINSKLANDSDVIWASVIQNTSSLMFVSRLDVIKEIVEKESSALSYVTNKKIVLNIVRQNGMLLSCVKSMFKSDKEVVLAAIENNPEALQFVLSHDVLVDVVKKNFKLFAFCSIFFKKNLNFVWDIVQIHPFLFSLITDKYVVLQIVEKNWKLLKFVSESFKSD